jgi:DNA-directed RNA polymerase II subunit RPB2
MEAAATGSHGAAHILQARFKQWSDAFRLHVCARCKLPADGNEEINYAWCRLCRSRQKVRIVSVPFTFLLTMTELMAMGIIVRIAVSEFDVPPNTPKKLDLDEREHWLRLYEYQEED